MSNDALGDIQLTHPGWTSQIENISRLLRDERVFPAGFSVFGFKVLTRLEQDNMLSMKEIIRELTFSDGLIMNCFAGTFSAAKECMLISQYKWLVGCNLDWECAALGPSQLVHLSLGKY